MHNWRPPCVDCETTCVCRHQRSRPRPRSRPPLPPLTYPPPYPKPLPPASTPPPTPTWNRPLLSMSNVSVQKYGQDCDRKRQSLLVNVKSYFLLACQLSTLNVLFMHNSIFSSLYMERFLFGGVCISVQWVCVCVSVYRARWDLVWPSRECKTIDIARWKWWEQWFHWGSSLFFSPWW